MRTVLYRLNEGLVVKKAFVGGYKPPKGHDFEKEKAENGIVELVLVIAEKPEYDSQLHELRRIERADLEVQNDYDGEFIVEWELIDLPDKQEVLNRRQRAEQRKQQALLRQQEIDDLKKQLQGRPSNSSEAINQIQLIKQILNKIL